MPCGKFATRAARLVRNQTNLKEQTKQQQKRQTAARSTPGQATTKHARAGNNKKAHQGRQQRKSTPGLAAAKSTPWQQKEQQRAAERVRIRSPFTIPESISKKFNIMLDSSYSSSQLSSDSYISSPASAGVAPSCECHIISKCKNKQN